MLEVLADMDVAALAGMLPAQTASRLPSWYTDDVGEDLREIQVHNPCCYVSSLQVSCRCWSISQ